ncbi:MAG: site-2 protease family protein [Anaerolineae bacterium]|nr:site-2 protease family protein [Anaerolineae bacterium]
MFDLTPANLIRNFIVLLVGMTVHEFAHAYGAYLMGDTTAKEQGKMTLDPRANIYPPGFIFAVLFGFGILGSAPVNPYRMRDPRWGSLFAVAAGPVSNLLIAALFAVPVRLGLVNVASASASAFLPSLPFLVFSMIWLNVLMFIFNLLPIYPLDGWRITLSVLPAQAAVWWERNRQTSMYIGMGLIILSFATAYLPAALRSLDPIGWLIGQPARMIVSLLIGR